MDGLSRRGFLRTALAGCAASTVGGGVLSSIDAVAQTCGVFNVVLHGLFLIDLATGYVQISSPDCTDTKVVKHKHYYRAGCWANSLRHFPEVSGKHEPIWPIPYTNPVIRDVPILKEKMGKPKHGNAYLTLTLPAPNAITGLRTFDKSEIDYPCDYMDATKFPLVTVLTYNSPPQFPPIRDTPWHSMNYHIFAEPQARMNCEEAEPHGAAVIQLLWNMFDTKPTTGPKPKKSGKGDYCIKPRDNRPAVRCVDSEEERALSELSGATTERHEKQGTTSSFQSAADNELSSLEAVHMPTCAVFVAP